LLARDFGMSRGDAAVEVTRFMILGSGAHFFIALVMVSGARLHQSEFLA
jgi:hypothetical protein